VDVLRRLFAFVEAAADGGVVAAEVVGDFAHRVAVLAVGSGDRVGGVGEEVGEGWWDRLPVAAGDLWDWLEVRGLCADERVGCEVGAVVFGRQVGRVVNEVLQVAACGGPFAGELAEGPVGREPGLGVRGQAGRGSCSSATARVARRAAGLSWPG
jgi:hypothetical protein